MLRILFNIQGYRQEFNKIQANHTTRMEREELLRGSGISTSSGLSRRDMYLKESSHLGRYVVGVCSIRNCNECDIATQLIYHFMDFRSYLIVQFT